ncbi:MAG: YbdD/YjiX family protein [Burkholderiales bacterium]
MMTESIKRAWHYLREVTGDDAYERYVAHQKKVHPEETPMSQRDYFKCRQDEKWSKVSRCC